MLEVQLHRAAGARADLLAREVRPLLGRRVGRDVEARWRRVIGLGDPQPRHTVRREGADPRAMSQRSPQLPAMISLHGGVTKQASTPSALATALPVSASYPSTSAAVSSFGSHFVSAGRVAPSTVCDCGGYAGSVERTSVPRVEDRGELVLRRVVSSDAAGLVAWSSAGSSPRRSAFGGAHTWHRRRRRRAGRDDEGRTGGRKQEARSETPGHQVPPRSSVSGRAARRRARRQSDGIAGRRVVREARDALAGKAHEVVGVRQDVRNARP